MGDSSPKNKAKQQKAKDDGKADAAKKAKAVQDSKKAPPAKK